MLQGSIGEADQRKFVKKFRAQSNRDAQHTLHELILGAFVAGQGFDPKYEPKIDGQTPEWRGGWKRSGLGIRLVDAEGEAAPFARWPHAAA